MSHVAIHINLDDTLNSTAGNDVYRLQRNLRIFGLLSDSPISLMEGHAEQDHVNVWWSQ